MSQEPVRIPQERRKEDVGPPPGTPDRRTNDADRRTTNNTEYVSFTVGDQILGIQVARVQEILFPKPFAKIPLSHKAVAGLINLRGQIVTAINLRERLGLAPANLDQSMNIIVSHEGELYSLVVDQVGDVIPVQTSTFSEPPASLDPKWASICDGVHQLKKGLLIIINVSTLLNFETDS